MMSMSFTLEEVQAVIRIMDPDAPGIFGCLFCDLVNTFAEVSDHMEAAHKAELANWALTNHGDELIEPLNVQGDT